MPLLEWSCKESDTTEQQTHAHTHCPKRDEEPRDEKKLPTFSRRSD